MTRIDHKEERAATEALAITLQFVLRTKFAVSLFDGEPWQFVVTTSPGCSAGRRMAQVFKMVESKVSTLTYAVGGSAEKIVWTHPAQDSLGLQAQIAAMKEQLDELVFNLRRSPIRVLSNQNSHEQLYTAMEEDPLSKPVAVSDPHHTDKMPLSGPHTVLVYMDDRTQSSKRIRLDPRRVAVAGMQEEMPLYIGDSSEDIRITDYRDWATSTTDCKEEHSPLSDTDLGIIEWLHSMP